MAVALKLAFGEELVSRGFVRKCWVSSRVLKNVRRLGAVETSLDIDQRPDGARSVHTVVAYVRDRATYVRFGGSGLHAELVTAKFDGDAEINFYFADGVAKIFELTGRVRSSINDDDPAATAKDHLIDT